MGIALKCSGSRMAHLILPGSKESESNEKRGVRRSKGSWAHGSGAVATRAERGEAEIGLCRVQKQQDDGEQRHGGA